MTVTGQLHHRYLAMAPAAVSSKKMCPPVPLQWLKKKKKLVVLKYYIFVESSQLIQQGTRSVFQNFTQYVPQNIAQYQRRCYQLGDLVWSKHFPETGGILYLQTPAAAVACRYKLGKAQWNSCDQYNILLSIYYPSLYWGKFWHNFWNWLYTFDLLPDLLLETTDKK